MQERFFFAKEKMSTMNFLCVLSTVLTGGITGCAGTAEVDVTVGEEGLFDFVNDTFLMISLILSLMEVLLESEAINDLSMWSISTWLLWSMTIPRDDADGGGDDGWWIGTAV